MSALHRKIMCPIVLFAFWAVIYTFHIEEVQLKFDAMTYGALAKHILQYNDWLTLHYTPSAYADYYQHPPLVMWAQALVFKAFGVSAISARLMPMVFALGTVMGVFAWGCVSGSYWLGLVAGIITLTTATYVKYSSDLYLDGPLAFFLVWGSVFFLMAERRAGYQRNFWSLAFGGAIALGFLTKGLVGLSLPLGCFLYAIGKRSRFFLLGNWIMGVAVAGGVLNAWWYRFGGRQYLEEYWKQSVAGRISSVGAWDHLGPLIGLMRSYWPWLPLFLWGSVCLAARAGGGTSVKAGRFCAKTDSEYFRVGPLYLAWLHGLIILGAFCYSGHYFEHYLVPFYPMAALVSAYPLADRLKRHELKLLQWLLATALVLWTLSTVYPGRLRTERTEPIREAARSAVLRCSGVKEILISSNLVEKWFGLATVLWETPWFATSITPPVAPSPEQLLITPPSANESVGWHRVIEEKNYVISEPPGTSLCK